MPSFSFWKSSKTSEVSQEPLLAGDTTPNESKSPAFVPKNLDLDPGNEDSGVFIFDEADLQAQESLPVSEEVTMVTDAVLLKEASGYQGPDKNIGKIHSSPGSSPEQPFLSSAVPNSTFSDTHSKKPGVVVKVTRKAQQTLDEQKSDLNTYNNDSPTSSRPTSFAAIDTALSRVPSIPSKHAPPTRPLPPQRTESLARLRRPAELNLSTSATTSDASKPRSELEQRHALIRNSKTQSKAALRSPTALLEERLQLTPNRDPKQRPSPKTRVFTPPPRTPENGCWIPGPGAQANPFTSSSIRASTEATKRPAWWCKFDKLVVFDGMCDNGSGTLEICTRTSKGLSIARRRGDLESIIIPLGCSHCQDMLKRHEWKYDMRVCKRSVCWECKERCQWEWEEELRGRTADKADGGRERADSVLQDG